MLFRSAQPVGTNTGMPQAKKIARWGHSPTQSRLAALRSPESTATLEPSPGYQRAQDLAPHTSSLALSPGHLEPHSQPLRPLLTHQWAGTISRVSLTNQCEGTSTRTVWTTAGTISRPIPTLGYLRHLSQLPMVQPHTPVSQHQLWETLDPAASLVRIWSCPPKDQFQLLDTQGPVAKTPGPGPPISELAIAPGPKNPNPAYQQANTCSRTTWTTQSVN